MAKLLIGHKVPSLMKKFGYHVNVERDLIR